MNLYPNINNAAASPPFPYPQLRRRLAQMRLIAPAFLLLVAFLLVLTYALKTDKRTPSSPKKGANMALESLPKHPYVAPKRQKVPLKSNFCEEVRRRYVTPSSCDQLPPPCFLVSNNPASHAHPSLASSP